MDKQLDGINIPNQMLAALTLGHTLFNERNMASQFGVLFDEDHETIVMLSRPITDA